MSKLKFDEVLIERALLKLFISDRQKREKLFPYLTEDIFSNSNYRSFFGIYKEFHATYGTLPKGEDVKARLITLDLKNAMADIGAVDLEKFTDKSLFDSIEILIKKRKLYTNFATRFQKLKDHEDDCLDIDIQELEKIKGFSLDENIGMDVFEDDGSKFHEYINQKDIFLPTGLKRFDEIMGGGLCRKAMTIVVSGVNRGKTALKCSLACEQIRQGKNVLFLTLEMPAEKIRDRIMVNMLNKTKEDLLKMSVDDMKREFARIKAIIKSKLVIKDYNEHELSAHKLKTFLIELKEKKQFKPDVVFLDYLGLVAPNTLSKEGQSSFSLKRASEEFHAVCKEFDFHLFTSMQFNRQGYNSENPDMDDISESFATLFTADEVILLIQTDEMLKELRYIYKKVKARTPGKGLTGNFRVDYTKMRFYEDGSDYDMSKNPKTAKIMQQAEDVIEPFITDSLTSGKKNERIGELEPSFTFD